MGSLPHGECAALLPLLARYDDPDLTEAEQIRLSLHVPRCAACWQRLEMYRRQDRQLRDLPRITLVPEARCTILNQIAVAPSGNRGNLLLPGITSVAVAALAVLLVSSMVLLRGPVQHELATSGQTANDLFVQQPLTATLLSTATTRVMTAINDTALPASQGQQLQARITSGTVRVLAVGGQRPVLTLARDEREETFVLDPDTPVRLANGQPGRLADLAVGAPIRLRYTVSPNGALTVLEIAIVR